MICVSMDIAGSSTVKSIEISSMSTFRLQCWWYSLYARLHKEIELIQNEIILRMMIQNMSVKYNRSVSKLQTPFTT